MAGRSGRTGFHVSMPMLWPMLTGLRAMGADVESIVKSASLSLQKLQDPDTRVPYEVGIVLAFRAALATGDEALGLHLAEHYRPGVFGVLDYLAHSSRTLGEAIGQLRRYNRLLQDAVETGLEVRDDLVMLFNHPLGDVQLPPGISENTIANLIVIGRELTGVDLIPVEVQFRHSAPSYVSEHERIFRAPIRFNAERDGLVLPLAYLDLPLPNADAGLCAILDRHAKQLLDQLPRVARFSQRVREIVAVELKEGHPTAESIARKLEMSERTLRRRLQDESTTYEQLVDTLRRGLAERYLAQSHLNIEEVGLMLGYSEARAFRRAFRRWNNVSPATYRKRQRPG
jgi:AraC-like DNA-binding protein